MLAYNMPVKKGARLYLYSDTNICVYVCVWQIEWSSRYVRAGVCVCWEVNKNPLKCLSNNPYVESRQNHGNNNSSSNTCTFLSIYFFHLLIFLYFFFFFATKQQS